MKILLVVYDNGSHIHWFPQGIAYIAAALKKNHEVKIYNQDIHHYPDRLLTLSARQSSVPVPAVPIM